MSGNQYGEQQKLTQEQLNALFNDNPLSAVKAVKEPDVSVDTGNVELSQTQLKTMYEFNRDWKRKNPGWTARQFKRAFLKTFPNNVK